MPIRAKRFKQEVKAATEGDKEYVTEQNWCIGDVLWHA